MTVSDIDVDGQGASRLKKGMLAESNADKELVHLNDVVRAFLIHLIGACEC